MRRLAAATVLALALAACGSQPATGSHPRSTPDSPRAALSKRQQGLTEQLTCQAYLDVLWAHSGQPDPSAFIGQVENASLPAISDCGPLTEGTVLHMAGLAAGAQ